MIYFEYTIILFFQSLVNAIVHQEYIVVISFFKVNYKMRTFQPRALVGNRAYNISRTWLLFGYNDLCFAGLL